MTKPSDEQDEKREFIKQYVLARASVAQGGFDGERCAMNAADIWKRIEAATPASAIRNRTP